MPARRIYRPIPEWTPETIEAAIVRDDPEELLTAVLSAALHAEDRPWAEGVCVRLASHRDGTVRGNAILGFGHIARIHRSLEQSRVLPLVEAGLRDLDAYVRGQAHASADDIEHFLGWAVTRPAVT